MASEKIGGRGEERLHGVWERYRKRRDDKNRGVLVEGFLPVVQAVVDHVSKRIPAVLDRHDLMGAGVCGLLRALDGYDPTRGTTLGAYCRLRIHGAILDELRAHDWVSRESRNRESELVRTFVSLGEKLGREPSERELASALGISVSQVRSWNRESNAFKLVSLDALSVEGDPSESSELHSAVDAVDQPSDIAHRRELWRLIEEQLSEIERRIVTLHYERNIKFKDVAKVLALSCSRVAQIHTGLLQRLKEKLATEAL